VLQQKAADVRDRLVQMLLARGETPPEQGSGDELDQALACIEALDADVKNRAQADAEYSNQRFAELFQVMAAIVAFDFTKKASFSGKDDTFDAFAVYLNMLAEELSSSMVSKAYVNNIIESMTDLLVVLGGDGRIRMANAAAAHLSGRAKQELIGQPVGLLFPEIKASEVIAKKGVFYEEAQCQVKARAPVAVSFSAAVMRNRRGEIEGIVCVGRDLSSAKRAEDERMRLREAMQRQAILLEELSTPLIPITSDIVVMPVIGSVDESRARQICEVLLHGIVSRRARMAIIDISGVAAVDEATLERLIKAVQGAHFLGAEVVLTGIRPQVARMLAHLGTDLGRVRTSRSLQSTIMNVLRR
jgi:rsbT co-antagonist protein RsbR